MFASAFIETNLIDHTLPKGRDMILDIPITCSDGTCASSTFQEEAHAPFRCAADVFPFFQHNGAPPHFASDVRQHLNVTFGQQPASLAYHIARPIMCGLLLLGVLV